MLRRVRQRRGAEDWLADSLAVRGRRLLGAVSVCALLAGCGPCDGDDEREATAPPRRRRRRRPPRRRDADADRQADAQQVPAGELAVGLTEQNPNFLWPAGAREVPAEFARWRDELAKLKPAYYRLVLDWPSLEPRERQAGVRLAQRRLPARQAAVRRLRRAARPAPARSPRASARAAGTTLVVLSGTPEWAARPAGGCERDSTTPRSRPPRRTDGGLHALRRARAGRGARGRAPSCSYWSPWNEPNHPYFISPQRLECDRDAPSAAVAPYVEMARALQAGARRGARRPAARARRAGRARRAPADDDLGRRSSSPTSRTDMACGSAIWTQHGYVGGRDPVDDLERALERKGCETPADLDHRDRRRRAAQRRGAADVAGLAGARVRAPAPAAAQAGTGTRA